MARIGYARVSTNDQHPENQSNRLKAAGCGRIYTDKGASGKDASRPEWDKCLERLESGDVLVTVRLDRLGRSIRNLIDVVTDLGNRGIDIVILDQGIDTTTAAGKFMFHIMASVAEFERDLIIERTNDGLARARENGGGIPPGRKREYTDTQAQLAKDLKSQGAKAETIAATLRVSRATVYRMLKGE